MTTRTTKTAGNTPAKEGGYFNMHLSGCGWLNRIRFVTPKRGGQGFLACAINALHGAVDEPERTCLDLRVSGGEAQKLVRAIQKRMEQNKDARVFVAFKAGDLYPHVYERQNRETGKPETAALIKGRLLSLTSIKIDGEKVWPKEPVEARENAPTPAPAKQEAPAPAPAPEEDDPFVEEEATETEAEAEEVVL